MKTLASRDLLPGADLTGIGPVDEGEQETERLVARGIEALPELAKAAQNPDWVVRYRAARVLGAIGTPQAVAILIRLIDDTNDTKMHVKASAWDALVRIDPQWEEVFRVRESPEELATWLGAPNRMGFLCYLLLCSDPSIRTATRRSVSARGGIGSLARAVILAENSQDDVKVAWYQAIRVGWSRSDQDDFERSRLAPSRIYSEIKRSGSLEEQAMGTAFREHWQNATLNLRGSYVQDGRDILVRPGNENPSTDPHELLLQGDKPTGRREAGSTDMSGKRSILSRLFSFGLLGRDGSNKRNRSDNAVSPSVLPTDNEVSVNRVAVVHEVAVVSALDMTRESTAQSSDATVVRHSATRLAYIRFIIDMVSIPAGEFLMGDDDRSDNPRRTVFLDAYHISKYPVTVKQYLAFVKATGHRTPFKPSWGWQDDHPVVGVSWDDATAYCQWLSMKTGKKITLPTEAQWEKASRGTDGRRYPWGEDWDNSRLQCSKEVYGDAGGTAAVGSYVSGASPYGVLDMAGNVWEWCSDWYDANHMRSAPTRNPMGPATGSSRVVRGGSWSYSNQSYFRCAYRNLDLPAFRYIAVGFRCCVSGLPK